MPNLPPWSWLLSIEGGDSPNPKAEMTSVDRLGFHVRLKTQDGMHGARIAFLREVTNPTQTREVFVEMLKLARQE